jgi:hypothetical protein
LSYIFKKCFVRNVIARIVHKILNQISVGRVLIVADQISKILVINAKMYSHQIETPKSRPGMIIRAFVVKARNSTVLGIFQ